MYVRARLCALHIWKWDTSLPASAKSVAPLRTYTRPRVHYDSLLGPFVGSPVLRFHFTLFSSMPPPPPSLSPSPSHGRLRLLYLFPDLCHPLALYPVRLVGAADTCRASASANGKEREKKGKRVERIKESKGPNKISLKTRPREKMRGRRGKGSWNRREGVVRCERARRRRDGEDSNGASGPAGVGEHSGVNRVQPQLGSLQPGSLRFIMEPVFAYSAVKTTVVGSAVCQSGTIPACFFTVVIFYLSTSEIT